ncbi:C40 family peptidase [Marinobacter zhejiangensis]|nr:NlpC/P60 family protein [Marinobacter zhejiangensis]
MAETTTQLRNSRRTVAALVLGALVLAGCASQPQTLPPVSVVPGVATGQPQEEAVFAEQDALAKLVMLQKVFSRYQGVPYRYGGTTSSGFDCSGFIRAAYREAFDHPLPRTTGEMVGLGQAVGRSQLQPGDLVFFHSNGRNGHAGIFMGDDRFIHASSSQGVTESSLQSSYWRTRYSQARRLVVP